tara:strand:- start:18 stop:233 length:216 start_codon:yes stop_codon:yes gene_type:complete
MARTITDLRDAISNLETILDTGASTIVSPDGTTTVFDLKEVNARLRDLKAELATMQGKKARRPIFNQLDLS